MHDIPYTTRHQCFRDKGFSFSGSMYGLIGGGVLSTLPAFSVSLQHAPYIYTLIASTGQILLRGTSLLCPTSTFSGWLCLFRHRRVLTTFPCRVPLSPLIRHSFCDSRERLAPCFCSFLLPPLNIPHSFTPSDLLPFPLFSFKNIHRRRCGKIV